MDWDQIENKWAAMTLRIRGDWAVNSDEGSLPSARRTPKPKIAAGSVANIAAPDLKADAGLKMAVE